MNEGADAIMTHDSAFATTLVDVTDPDTPVWNEVLGEFRERLTNAGLLTTARSTPPSEPQEQPEPQAEPDDGEG